LCGSTEVALTTKDIHGARPVILYRAHQLLSNFCAFAVDCMKLYNYISKSHVVAENLTVRGSLDSKYESYDLATCIRRFKKDPGAI